MKKATIKRIKSALIVVSVICDICLIFSSVEAGHVLIAALGFAWLAAVLWANR